MDIGGSSSAPPRLEVGSTFSTARELRAAMASGSSRMVVCCSTINTTTVAPPRLEVGSTFSAAKELRAAVCKRFLEAGRLLQYY